MVKKIRCDVDSSDWVRGEISSNGEHVRVTMAGNDAGLTVILTPSDARKLRKQVKKALEAIECEEEEKEEPKPKNPRFPDWFREGAIVEIVGNSNKHQFEIGDKVRVITSLRCEDLDGRDWWFVLPADCKPA